MLMVAAMHGRSRCVSALLGELGAEPDVATVGKQETALHLAAFHGHAAAVSELLQAGADTSLQNDYGETAEQAALAARKPQCASLIAAAHRAAPQPEPQPEAR